MQDRCEKDCSRSVPEGRGRVWEWGGQFFASGCMVCVCVCVCVSVCVCVRVLGESVFGVKGKGIHALLKSHHVKKNTQ